MSAKSAPAVVVRPWERPFWKPTEGKGVIFFYLVLIHVLAIIGLVFFPLPSLPVLGATILIACLGGLGTTVVYHRTLSHRSLKLNKFVEQVLVFWTMFNGSGAPASWVAYHRHHHSRADTPDDISSPKHGGFWWAHMRWLYQSAPAEPEKWCPELNKGIYKFWTSAELPVIAASILCGAFFGWSAFFWMGAVRLVYCLHMQCFVNSLTHLGSGDDGDTSQNVWWLGPLQMAAWGENWHRNHHSYAGSARLGIRWYQVDVGWYFIRFLETFGLAREVRLPREDQIRAA